MRIRVPVGTSYPGNEVPKWFEYQAERSSIGIKLPLKWHNYNFLGFVFCVVGYSYRGTYKNLNLSCQINFKSNEGENHEFESNFAMGDPIVKLLNLSDSSDVYMWPWLGNCRECQDAVEASFCFSSTLGGLPSWIYGHMDTFKVKKCGIHMLYLTDLEKFGFNLTNDVHLFEDSDSAVICKEPEPIFPDQPESSTARGTFDTDADEPQPKKHKVTDFCDC